PLPPTVTSGLRIGTPAITTRGMREQETLLIVNLIDAAIKNRSDAAQLAAIREQVTALCKQFPAYE
ncbi:serine hydroxymethyltransferase, partial [bacterium]|nr:serine hydroxymethyltransferase [bacterium]